MVYHISILGSIFSELFPIPLRIGNFHQRELKLELTISGLHPSSIYNPVVSRPILMLNFFESYMTYLERIHMAVPPTASYSKSLPNTKCPGFAITKGKDVITVVISGKLVIYFYEKQVFFCLQKKQTTHAILNVTEILSPLEIFFPSTMSDFLDFISCFQR